MCNCSLKFKFDNLKLNKPYPAWFFKNKLLKNGKHNSETKKEKGIKVMNNMSKNAMLD